MSQGKAVNVAAFVSIPELEGIVYDRPWVRVSSKDEVAGEYAGWDSTIVGLLNVRISGDWLEPNHKLMVNAVS